MPLFIPSPSISGFQLGPLNIHFYAVCILLGIFAAWGLGVKRWTARGGTSDTFETCIIIAIPMGVVGARVYHVLTHWGDYFGPGQLNPFFIWEGGIAIFGAIGLGAFGAWIGSRVSKVSFAALAVALAAGLVLAQC
ncbi:MAG: prolipoprotein diacylglyceryl transferase, partial [Propionibacteriaceae bacterium]|nr:prolipoprotein diacylglyceryl transferase [Propionibacteriaceae bacterium]